MNTTLIAQAAARARQILTFVATRSIQLNVDLANHFKTVEKRSLAVPDDTEALVEQVL